MQSKPFLNVGTQYTYIAELDNGRKTYMGRYLGFQVEGGITIFAFECTTKKGELKPLYLQAHQFVCAEPVEAQSSTVDTKQTLSASKTEDVSASSSDTQVRGQTQNEAPKNHKPVLYTSSTDSDATPAKRKPGRPPKDPNAVKAPKPVVTTSPVDADGNPVKRKPGRPRKVSLEQSAVPPNIPTPSVVEEVDEIEEATASSDDEAVNVAYSEKAVTTAVAPQTSDDDDTNDPGIIALNNDDNDEVVPARTRLAPNTSGATLPKRPVSNLARSHVPDEIEGDL